MPGADSDITSTLSDLEHKLQALETELATVGDPAATPVAPPPSTPPLPTATGAPLAGLYGQMAELERFRETLEESARALIEEYRRLLEHVHVAPPAPGYPSAPAGPPAPVVTTPPDGPSITGGWAPTAPAPVLPPLPSAEVELPLPPPPAVTATPGVPDGVADAPTTGADPTVEGRLTVDAGPFGDIATLSQFEQALGRLPGAQDVYVKGFEGHRALIDLQLAAPIALATHLRQVSPLVVTVHEPVPGSSQLKVDVEGAPDA